MQSLSLPVPLGQTRIHLYAKNVDMRKSFDGLHAIIQSEFQRDVRLGDLFLFLNRRRDRLKLMYWDRDGFAIFMKRLECGTFQRPPAALAGEHDRITWDAPIHSVADVLALAFKPRVLNVKPSRFGTVRALFEFYDYCEAQGIGLYGGGQTELGVGRGQIQYLASLFHPDTPNDVAPAAYNIDPLPDGLPGTPLDAAPSATGFRWEDRS